MKVAIEKDEWWPVYTLQERTDNCHEEEIFEIAPELIDEYWEAMTRFTDIQLKLRLIKERNRESGR